MIQLTKQLNKAIVPNILIKQTLFRTWLKKKASSKTGYIDLIPEIHNSVSINYSSEF